MGSLQTCCRLRTAAAGPQLVALLIAIAAAPGVLAAQQPPEPRPGTLLAGATPMDPIGFLLEHRDSLRLADTVVMQLVRVNMRLFRQNRQLQMRLDSILPVGMGGPQGPARGGNSLDGLELPDSLVARVRELVTRMRENARTAQDAAFALLSDSQQVKARELETAGLRRERQPAEQRPRRP